MKYLYIRLFIATVFTAVSFNLQAEDTNTVPVEGEFAELKESVTPEEKAELTKEDEKLKSWDETVEKKIKKKRGFKKIKDRLDKLGDRGSDALDSLFDKLKDIDIEFSIDDKVEIIDGLEIGGGYEYEAGPAFYGDFYSRVDGYSASLPVSVLDLFGIESDFGIHAEPHVEVRFMQFFDSETEARKLKNGYLPNKLPVTADKAKDLKPGDLVMIDGRLNFSYGIGKLWDEIKDWLGIRLRASSHVNGLFRAFVFRGNDDMVRVRVSALYDTPKIVSGRISVFDFFDLGWSRLTDLVERVLKLKKLVHGERHWIDRDLWIADYTLDLSDEMTKRAYNEVFRREGRFMGLVELANPFKRKTDESRENTRNKLFDLVQPLTDAVNNNPNKNNKNVVNFMGSNYSNGGSVDFEAGVRGIARGGVLRSKKDNHLKQTFFDADGSPRERFYFFPSWVKRSEFSGCVTYCREKKHQAANIIYTADKDFNIIEFQNIGFYREETDKAYSYKEHVKMLDSFQRILPPALYAEFEDELVKNGWGKFSGKRKNVRLSARYFINREGLKRVASVTSEQIQRHLIKSLDLLDQQETHKKFGFAGKETPTGTHIPRDICPLEDLKALGAKTWKPKNSGRKWVLDANGEYLAENTLKYCNDVKKFSDQLASSLQTGLEASVRHERFSAFTESSLFRKVGPGLLFDILGSGSKGMSNINELTFFEIVLNRSGKPAVRFKRGEIENRPLYEIILQMERILNEDEPDLRFPGNEETPVERIIEAS